MMSDEARQRLHDAYQTLYDALDGAYWSASAGAKDRILTVKDGVSSVLAQIDAEDLASRDGAFDELAKAIADQNLELDRLHAALGSLVLEVASATQVASGIDAVLEAAEAAFGTP